MQKLKAEVAPIVSRKPVSVPVVTAKPKPKPVRRPSPRPVKEAVAVLPGLSGPVQVAAPGKDVQKGFVARKDTKLHQGQRVFRVYDSTGKVSLGYAVQMRGMYYVQG